MPSILIKNLPTPIHEALKENAKHHHRSLNREIIHALEKETARTLPGKASQPPSISPDYSETTLATYPPEVAARLRALRELGESLAARDVDFQAWENAARESRR
jgi:hypothetical protein